MNAFASLYTTAGIATRVARHGAFHWFLTERTPLETSLGLPHMHGLFRESLELAQDIGLLSKNRRQRLRMKEFKDFFQVTMELLAAKMFVDRWCFKIDPEPIAGSSVGEFDIVLGDGRRVFCEVKSPFHPDEEPDRQGYMLANTEEVAAIRRTIQKARHQLPWDRASLVVFAGVLRRRSSFPFLAFDAYVLRPRRRRARASRRPLGSDLAGAEALTNLRVFPERPRSVGAVGEKHMRPTAR